MFAGKNVLVAGGAGFIGANLVKRLLETGANVRATLHASGSVIIDEKVDYVRCDLTQINDCRRVVEDMDYIFMCAAFSSGAAVIAASPLAIVTPNVVMNTQMLEAAYAARVRKFIFISSSVVYPPSGGKPCKEDEMMDGEPYDIYYGPAWMKRYAEILCRLYSEKLKRPLSTIVVRPSNIFGPHDDFDYETSHVMAATIRKVIERQNPLNVWGSGEDVRDFIYIDDFIDGLLLAAANQDGYDPVNIASGQGFSVMQILEMLFKIENLQDVQIVRDPSKPSMIPIRLFDISKARRTLGFEAKTDLEAAMVKTIQWYRNTRNE